MTHTIQERDDRVKERTHQRETVTRALHQVAKALDELPDSGPEVAGYLKAFGVARGDRTPENNPLAKYLARRIPHSDELFRRWPNVTVTVTEQGADVEAGDFWAHMELPHGPRMFLTQFLNGAYPYLHKEPNVNGYPECRGAGYAH